MADAKASAVFEVRAVGTDKASRQFVDFEKKVSGSMSSSEAAVARSLGNIAAQYISIGYAINKAMKFMSSGVEFNKFVETQTMSFSVMMKSAEKAKVQMEQLYDFAVKSPLTFRETASSAKQLMAYGFTAKELIPTLDKLGTVALATGHSLGDIAYVYGTLKSQGRAYSRDLMQFGMRGIPIYEELAKVMNVNVSQIQKMASEGKIGFREVEKAFESMTGVGGRFSGMIEQYMSTLTGKLSMLSDIAEKSAGKMMRGATDSFKKFVDELTVLLESDKMQAYFTELNIDIKTLADVVLELVKAFIELLPLLTKALKVFLAYKAVTGIFSVLKGLPELLLKVGGALMSLSVVGGGAGFIANLGAAGSLFAQGFAMAAPVILAVLAPILLALKMIKDLKEDAYMQSSDEAFTEVFSIRGPETIKAIQADINMMRNQGLPAVEAEKKLNAEIVDYVTRTANQYGKTTEELAKMLYLSNQISATAAKMLGFDIAGHFAKAQAEIARMNTAATPLSAMERETKYFSELTGRDAKEFIDPNDAHAFGRKAANVYLDGFQETWKEEKLKWQNLFTDDKQQDLLKSELDAITKQYNDAFARLGSAGMEKSGFGPRLREQMLQIIEQLEDGFGKGLKNKIPELTKWWLPDDAAVAKSLTAVDDVALAGEKAVYNAQMEIKAREDIIKANIEANKGKPEEVLYQQELVELKQQEKQILDDVTKYQEQQIALAKYNEMISGKAGFWDAFRGNAANSGGAKQFGGVLATSAEGTEVGNMVAGGGLMPNMAMSLGTFLTSIENVAAVLNPLTTMFEAMRGMVEPLMNNALEPLIMILQQVGEVIGKVLAPFIALIQIVTSLAYGAFAPLLAAIDWVSGGFLWFFDYVIMPVGNFIIDAINAVIRVINMIPGVHIKYLKHIKRSTDALEDFANAAKNVQNSLGDTISYLEDKLSDIYDKQLNSIQDLYDVGAMSATEYEAQVKTLNDSMVNSSDALVSYADKQLSTQEDILVRLRDLYSLQTQIDKGTLTDKEIADLLTQHGLTSMSLADTMVQAITVALTKLGIGGGNTESISAYGASSDIMQKILGGYSLDYGNINKANRKAAEAEMSPYYNGNSIQTKAQFKSTMMVRAIEADYNAMKAQIESIGYTNPDALQALVDAFEAKWGNYVQFDVGTGSVPMDMNATVHRGEGIIPKTFMDSIRSGELTLGGRNQGNGQNIIVNVTVEGSVTSERDLASSIAGIMYQQRSRGVLTY